MSKRHLFFVFAFAATAALRSFGDSASLPAETASTQPASAPAATEPASPEEVVITYFTAIARGDREKALGQLWFAKDTARREATAVIGIDCVSTDFVEAADDAFPRAAQVPRPGRDQVAEAIRKTLAGASVDIEGNTAELIIAGAGVGGGRVLSLVKNGDGWKIDFIRMQRRAGVPAMDDAAINATLARVKVYDDVIANIKAGRYKNASAANEDLSARLDSLPASPAPLRKAPQPLTPQTAP